MFWAREQAGKCFGREMLGFDVLDEIWRAFFSHTSGASGAPAMHLTRRPYDAGQEAELWGGWGVGGLGVWGVGVLGVGGWEQLYRQAAAGYG